MAIRVALNHQARYFYDRPMMLSPGPSHGIAIAQMIGAGAAQSRAKRH
jgi:hypothetical protein